MIMLQTMIVGSLPKPTWLAESHRLYAPWRLEGELLSEGQDDAVLLALADQQEAGLDILTDGEQSRRHYIWGFCEGLTGLDFSQLVNIDRKSTRLNSSHRTISYAVFCLKKKKKKTLHF